MIARIKKGLPPVEAPPPKPDTLAFVARDWLKRYVGPNGLRTGREIERKLNRYIIPRLGDHPIVEIKRKQVIELLNKIADEHGPRQADTCKTVLASMANWYRDEVNEDYVPPFGRIKRRSTAEPRDRVLDHDELRAIWAVASAEEAGPFAAIVKLCLLTGQRKQKVVAMRHSDIIDGVVVNTVHEEVVHGVITKTMRRKTFDGVWRIPQAPREKDSGGDLALPQLALDVLAKQPRHATNRYVFPAHSGPDHLHAALTQNKRRFDAQLPSGFRPWVLHDLRRSSRSLMSEAGVDRDIAERVLGHRVGGGVERIYDRFSYIKEKAEALQKLADYIEIILAGPVDTNKVVPLRPASS